MNGSLSDILEKLESNDFNAEMSVFSGFNSFFSAIQRHPVVEALVTQVASSPEAENELAMHMMRLLQSNEDVEYAHPYDVTLACYLYALGHIKSRYFRIVSGEILTNYQLVWARKLVEQNLRAELHQIGTTAEVIYNDSPFPRLIRIRSNASNSSNSENEEVIITRQFIARATRDSTRIKELKFPVKHTGKLRYSIQSGEKNVSQKEIIQ